MTWVEKEGYATEQLASADDLRAPGCDIQRVRFYNGKGTHYHGRRTEFFYFTGGTGKAVVDGREVPLSAGTVLIVKPGQRHSFVNEGKNTLDALVVKTNNDPKDTFEG